MYNFPRQTLYDRVAKWPRHTRISTTVEHDPYLSNHNKSEHAKFIVSVEKDYDKQDSK